MISKSSCAIAILILISSCAGSKGKGNDKRKTVQLKTDTVKINYLANRIIKITCPIMFENYYNVTELPVIKIGGDQIRDHLNNIDTILFEGCQSALILNRKIPIDRLIIDTFSSNPETRITLVKVIVLEYIKEDSINQKLSLLQAEAKKSKESNDYNKKRLTQRSKIEPNSEASLLIKYTHLDSIEIAAIEESIELMSLRNVSLPEIEEAHFKLRHLNGNIISMKIPKKPIELENVIEFELGEFRIGDPSKIILDSIIQTIQDKIETQLLDNQGLTGKLILVIKCTGYADEVPVKKLAELRLSKLLRNNCNTDSCFNRILSQLRADFAYKYVEQAIIAYIRNKYPFDFDKAVVGMGNNYPPDYHGECEDADCPNRRIVTIGCTVLWRHQ